MLLYCINILTRTAFLCYPCNTMHIDVPQTIVAALAFFVALRYGMRETGFRRFIVAPLALVVAALSFFGAVPPAVCYGLLSLTMAAAFLFNLLQDERGRRRRVASLRPRGRADVFPSIWVGCATVSVLLLTPSVMSKAQLAPAAVVGICSLAMAAIAWRIASAPVQLSGENIPLEQAEDRAMRTRRAGLTCVVAVGNVFAFICIVGDQPFFMIVSLVMWVALWASVTWYAQHLDRLSCSPSS